MDYIHTHSHYYIGGILWITGHTDDHLTACLQNINEVSIGMHILLFGN